MNKGLIRSADFCEHKGILSIQTLQEKYQLPDSEIHRYSQIVHFLKTLQHTSDLTTSTYGDLLINIQVTY